MRPGNLSDRSHILPQPPKLPWNSDSLSWTSSSPYTGLMEFNAIQPNAFLRDLNRHKRKSDPIATLPAKQQITDDKMAAHLNSLHISTDFVEHNTNSSNIGVASTSTSTVTSSATDTDSMDADLDQLYPMTSKDLEEKLKRANRITVCNEIMKLQETDNIIPKALLNHYQKPCTALIIWQPPQKLSDYIVPAASAQSKSPKHLNDDDDSDDSDTEYFMDNNNSSSVDLNNYSMETDL